MNRSLVVGCVLLAGAAVSSKAAAQAVEAEETEAPGDYRTLTTLGLGGAYVGFGAWTWVAWYRERPQLPRWRFGGDGGFGVESYAGGADKVGHAWATFVLSRLGADLLEAGGWDSAAASALSASFCLGAFTLVEVNDGYYTEFSPGDLGADAAGVAAALSFRHVPGLDNTFDFRVQWFPSREFRRHPGANFAEDYSGQSYLLAFKPSAIEAIRTSESALQLLQFVNPVLGFESRNYVPTPPPGQAVTRRQALFFGVTLDVQVLLDFSIGEKTPAAARVGHVLFEYGNLPYSTLRVLDTSRQAALSTPGE